MFNNGSWRNLNVWKESHAFVIDLHNTLRTFPKNEQFAIVDQMRRASYSVPANIIEGHSKNSNKDFTRFLYISRGSLEELRYFLLLSRDLTYIDNKKYQYLEQKAQTISKMLNGLINSLKHNT